MTASRSTSPKPGLVNTIAVMTLINGILNLLYGLGVTTTIVVGTLGFGLLCAWLTILPCILGVFEILYAVKLLASPPQPVRPSQTIAILEICCVLAGNVVSGVVGILALIFYSDATVKAYFAMLNGQPAPVPPGTPPVQPASPVLPVVTEPERPLPAAQPALPMAAMPVLPVETSQPAAPVIGEVEPTKAIRKPARPKAAGTKPARKTAKPAARKSTPASRPAKPKKKKPGS